MRNQFNIVLLPLQQALKRLHRLFKLLYVVMPPASVAFIKWGDIQTIWEGGEPYLGDLMFFGGLNNFLEIMK